MEKQKIYLIAAGIGTSIAIAGGTYALVRMNAPSTPETPVVAPSNPTAEKPQTSAPAPTSSPPAAAPQSTPQSPQSAPAPSAQPPQTESQPTAAIPPQPLNTAPEVCQVTQAIINDPNPPTNVRSSPEVVEGNVVGQLESGTYVIVKSQQGDWFEIENPISGWISANLTETSCSQKVQRVSFQTGSSGAIVSSQFIGSGTHDYLLQANAGQTMTITSQEGPLPFVFAPGDVNLQQDLAQGAANSNQQSWTGKLPATGDYTLQMISNYKGYVYEFTVEVN